MQVGMAYRDRLRSADMRFLLGLMDELESERAGLCVEQAEEAARCFALDLYARARASDKPEIEHPHPSMRWVVVEAPMVAQAFHASAVIMDSLKQFGPLSPRLENTQAHAHRRSQQLSAQLAKALSSHPIVPPEWRPFPYGLLQAAMLPPSGAAPAPAAPSPSPAPAISFPSVPSGYLPKRQTTNPAGGPPPTPPPPPPPAAAAPSAAPDARGPPSSRPAAPGTRTPSNSTPPPPPPPPPSAAGGGEGHRYTAGEEVWYRDGSGQWLPSRIEAVHYDDPSAPYFAIALAGGSLRDTEASRLLPRMTPPPNPTPPLNPAPHPTNAPLRPSSVSHAPSYSQPAHSAHPSHTSHSSQPSHFSQPSHPQSHPSQLQPPTDPHFPPAESRGMQNPYAPPASVANSTTGVGGGSSLLSSLRIHRPTGAPLQPSTQASVPPQLPPPPSPYNETQYKYYQGQQPPPDPHEMHFNPHPQGQHSHSVSQPYQHAEMPQPQAYMLAPAAASHDPQLAAAAMASMHLNEPRRS
ncbi:MAG: hypothetical protein SGPRY_014044 [Prymnesium sp.]